MLYHEFGIEYITLQIDHVGDYAAEGSDLRFLPQIKEWDVRWTPVSGRAPPPPYENAPSTHFNEKDKV